MPRDTTKASGPTGAPPPKTGPLTAATYTEAVLRYTKQRGGPFPVLDSREETDRSPMAAWLAYFQAIGCRKRAEMMRAALLGSGGSTTYTVAERWPSELTGEAMDDRHRVSIELDYVSTETGRLSRLPRAVRLAFEVAAGRMSQAEADRQLAAQIPEAAE